MLILYGGRSAEHGVSCLSAAALARAIDPDRYDVVTVGVTPDGRWVTSDGVPAARPGSPLPRVDGSYSVTLVARDGVQLLAYEQEAHPHARRRRLLRPARRGR